MKIVAAFCIALPGLYYMEAPCTIVDGIYGPCWRPHCQSLHVCIASQLRDLLLRGDVGNAEIQAPNSAFSFLLGMSAAAVAGLLWPVLNPILDVFYHWWTQYMDCSPCLPGEEGAQPGVRRRQGNTPPRPPAPGPAGYRLRQFRQAESPLYSSS